MTPRSVKLSRAIRRELDLATGTQVVVAAVVLVDRNDTERYAQLGLRMEQDLIVTGDPAPPPRACGPQARRNLDGWDDKRTDLAKEMRGISNWAPNWHSSAYHLISRTIEAWPVEHHPAKLLTISASVLASPAASKSPVRFRVDQPLHRNDPEFEESLLSTCASFVRPWGTHTSTTPI